MIESAQKLQKDAKTMLKGKKRCNSAENGDI